MNTEDVVYVLESLTAHGWSDDPCLLGSAVNCNVFDSIDAAQVALKELQLLWPDSTLRIRKRSTTPEPALVVMGDHGIYIPQLWCSDIAEPDCEALHVQWSDVQTCQSGPDHDWYWEAWQSILDDCWMVDEHGITWTLHQDGDLWEVPEGFSFPEF